MASDLTDLLRDDDKLFEKTAQAIVLPNLVECGTKGQHLREHALLQCHQCHKDNLHPEKLKLRLITLVDGGVEGTVSISAGFHTKRLALWFSKQCAVC